jgi:hypothetical protein
MSLKTLNLSSVDIVWIEYHIAKANPVSERLLIYFIVCFTSAGHVTI